MCKRCYDDGTEYPDGLCSVCGIRFDANEAGARKRKLPTVRYVEAFNEYLATVTLVSDKRAAIFRDHVARLRNLTECPIRAVDSICDAGTCYLRTYGSVDKKTSKPLQKIYRYRSTNPVRTVGRPVVHTTPLSGSCHVCPNPLDETSKARWAAEYEGTWELFFWKERQATGRTLDTVDKFEPTSAICNPCYMRWYKATKARKSSSVGAMSYKDAATLEMLRADKLQRAMDNGGPQVVSTLALSKVQVLFRAKILMDVLSGCEPRTVSYLRGVLEGMIETASGCEHVLKGTTPGSTRAKSDVQKLGRYVEDALNVVYMSAPYWSMGIGSTGGDQRTHDTMVLPVGQDITQVTSIVANMQRRIDSVEGQLEEANRRILALELDKARVDASSPTREDDIVRKAAGIIRVALHPYGKANNAFVFEQASGTVGLRCPSATEEFEENARSVLATFVSTLALDRQVDLDDDEEVLAHVSRKCLIAGVLTSFATNTWWKYANIAGLFLKERGIGRRGLDWLAQLLGITRTDNAMWRLQQSLSKHHGSQAVMRELVPKDGSWVGLSWDNVNIECRVDHGKNGRIDVIASIVYFHAKRELAPVIDISPDAPRSLELDRDFGMTYGRISSVWEEWEIEVATCALDGACTASDEYKKEGDFELRLAKRHVAKTKATLPGKKVGVDGRRIPEDMVMNFLGIELLGTKTLSETTQYLDRISRRLHVGVEGGRTRAVVAGDQETFSNMHKAKAKYPQKYSWVLPWVGDWHLLEHTLDVMFRKWGGFGLYKLARASGCYDKKLEGKSYHKRHFVFTGILEAVWKACASEVAQVADGGEEVRLARPIGLPTYVIITFGTVGAARCVRHSLPAIQSKPASNVALHMLGAFWSKA